MLFLVLETNVWKKENHSKQKTTFPNHPFEKTIKIEKQERAGLHKKRTAPKNSPCLIICNNPIISLLHQECCRFFRRAR